MNLIGWALMAIGAIHVINGVASLQDTFITPPVPYSIDVLHYVDSSFGLGWPMILSGGAVLALGFSLKG
jgi:hypothetical protein